MNRFAQLLRACWSMPDHEQSRVLTRLVTKLEYLDDKIESVSMAELADRLADAVAEVKATPIKEEAIAA